MSQPFPLESWDAHGETVGALLARRAGEAPERGFLTLLDDANREEVVTYAGLHDGARRMAAGLRAQGVGPGDRIMIALPTGRAFLEVFFAASLLGAIAVPCYPPARSRGLDTYQENLGRLLAAAAPRVIVTFKRARVVLESTAFRAGVPARVLEADGLPQDASDLATIEGDGSDIGLIQFSSGSTAAPKGVMLSHRAMLANVSAAVAVIRPSPEDVTCSWLPLYHDMGLIGMVLMPLISNTKLVLLSPQAFLLDTKRWLWAIHRYRCTISTAPNFAYQLVATRLKDSELDGLDLSCWRRAYNGAEPVLPSTMRAFAAKLAPHRFDAGALTPIYGLAEVAVAATFPWDGPGTKLDRIDPARLAAEGVAVPLETSGPIENHGVYASVGRALPGYRLRIAGPDGAERSDRHVGEIQIQGPSVMSGYLNDPASTAEAFQDGWLRTGDLGYLVDGELHVVGRLKDMILKGGRNYAPQDLEVPAQAVEGVRKGCVAAFGVPDLASGTEAVVIVAETSLPAPTHGALARDIARQVAEVVGLKPDTVLLVPPGTVPKTSSGKVQRRKCREAYLARALNPQVEPGLVDQARLFGQAIAHRLGGTRSQEGNPHG
jgi:acyl-CoA synthetase (AMP-forming)/AMP-acid ligase II